MVTLGVGIAGSGQKTGQRIPRSGHSKHPAGVRHQFGMLSAFSVERCPPSRWNTVRHQHGTVSAIAWNTQDGTYTCVQDVLTRLATRKASRVEQPRSHRPENTERPIDSR